MTVSRARWPLVSRCGLRRSGSRAIASSAQSASDTSIKVDRNLTQQAQNEVAVALPSFAPLAERVLPALAPVGVLLLGRIATTLCEPTCRIQGAAIDRTDPAQPHQPGDAIPSLQSGSTLNRS
jgi:hypothetical protein